MQCLAVAPDDTQRPELCVHPGEQAVKSFYALIYDATPTRPRTLQAQEQNKQQRKEYLASQDVEKSALFGSAAASFAVEDFGVKGINGSKEIEGRLKSRVKD